MNLANPVLELVKNLWGLASKPLGYICNLKDNVRSLKKANESLKAMSEDLKAKVELEEAAGAHRTKLVVNWFGEVQEFVRSADQVLQEAGEPDQINCFSSCLPQNCWSSYKLGRRVDRLLNEAGELERKNGKLSDFTLPLPLPPSPVHETPMGKTVGLDKSLDLVWKWLVDEKQVQVIGLYGIGGVGKTTLMKRIKEKLQHANQGFEAVIWVVVSRQVNEENILDAIRKGLNIEDRSWEGLSRDARVRHLRDLLTHKKFVLLIDDVWARLDLSKIGVPCPDLENGSKVVLTTRSKHVCNQMGSNRTFAVKCLTDEEAMALFENNVGKHTMQLDPEIRQLTNDIVRECEGLPLALITVGQAMAGITNPREWKHTLTTLQKRPHEVPGMEEKVYHILEFSYNRLDDPTLQHCFLYCCLFPEDYHIRPHDLIGLWIGEGLLGDANDVYSLRNQGEHFLGRLKRACLLESGDDSKGEFVKMHDVIRDMATWIARDHGQKENKLLVIENVEEISKEMISKWREAKKVSLWGRGIRSIDQTPSRCSRLETLFVRETNLTLVPRRFFNSMMLHLTVLDLSDNKNIESFPEEICNLINLWYLNLSATSIRELSRKINKLTHLRWLLLDNMRSSILIPPRAIASLPLNVFSMWTDDEEFEAILSGGNEEEMLAELECMQYLTDLSIHMHTSSSVQKVFQSSNQRRRLRRVAINSCGDQTSFVDFTSIVISRSPTGNDGFSRLEVLLMIDCPMIKEIKIAQKIGPASNCSCFPSLAGVDLFKCGFSDLSWLVHAPKLRELGIRDCQSMEKIIGDGFAPGELAALRPFSHLNAVYLSNLPQLTSICDEVLSFPSGVRFDIRKCPGLRKLPLDSSSARGGGFSVCGDKKWWAVFEWDPAARVTLPLGGGAVEEEMTYGEARRRVEDYAMHYGLHEMRFLPDGPSE